MADEKVIRSRISNFTLPPPVVLFKQLMVLILIFNSKAVVVVGESGCGKTSLAKAVLRLLPRNVSEYSGKVWLRDIETMELSDEEYRKKIRWLPYYGSSAQ